MKKKDLEKAADMINSPDHYTKGGLEVIDILEAKFFDEELEGYLKGNVIKYIFRYKLKNGVEDLKKARWYLNRLINFYDEKGAKK